MTSLLGATLNATLIDALTESLNATFGAPQLPTTTTATLEYAEDSSTTMNASVANTTQCYDCDMAPEHFLDQIYLLTFGIMIVFMDLGFGLIEAGSVRSKNTTHILIKNILDSFTAGIAYWLVGYALAFGKGNEFMGWHNWAMHDLHDSKISFFFYQAMFASTATTIVAGAVTERCEFKAYLIYSFFLTAFIYPVVTHWGWTTQGWLYQGYDFEIHGVMETIRYEDYGGSGLVHLVGGSAAFVATCFLGPRIGRFHKETGTAIPIRGHSIALATLGIFVLLFGFMSFNAASQLHITQPGDASVISLAVFNTLISASVGGFASLITHRVGLFGNTWNINAVINGAFVGMVAICGGCNAMRPWAAGIVGLVACFIMKGLERALIKLQIDDPLNAVGIHFGGGSWGALSIAFLKYDTGILMSWDKRSFAMLAWQMAAVASIILWTATTSLILFGCLKVAGIFRVSEEIEKKGLDIARHSQPAYPIEAYGHGHVEDIKTIGLDGKLSSIELAYTNKAFTTDEGNYETPEGKGTDVSKFHSYDNVTELGSPPKSPMSRLAKLKQLMTASLRKDVKPAVNEAPTATPSGSGDFVKVHSVGVDISTV